MKIIEPKVEILSDLDGEYITKLIEKCGRVCYKSEDLIKEDSSDRFCRRIIARGHEAVLEHASVTVKFTVDRGVSHEIVRHRMASYCQESTRYCNYSNDKFGREISVIKPSFYIEGTDEYNAWEESCKAAEEAYFKLIDSKSTPQEARSVLPNSLKTEIVMTANIREWRHFLKLRCDKAAHPQIREVSLKLLKICNDMMPSLFGDIAEMFKEEIE